MRREGEREERGREGGEYMSTVCIWERVYRKGEAFGCVYMYTCMYSTVMSVDDVSVGVEAAECTTVRD